MSTPYGENPGQGWSAPGQSGAGQPDYGQADYSQVQPHYGTPVGAQPVVLASWGRRFAAVLIDGVFVSALQLVMVMLLALLSNISEVLGMVLGAVGYLAIVIWFMLLEAGPYGQTPGKAVMKIRVRKADGTMLTKGGSVGRYFARILSALPFYLGFLWPLWDAENRTFHDMIMSTRVVTAPDTPAFGEVLKGPFSGRAA